MNRGFSIGIGDVTPGENLVKEKNKLLHDGYDIKTLIIEKIHNFILQVFKMR